MTSWREDAAQGALGPGTSISFCRTFTSEDVATFGRVTRDTNPVHSDQRWCDRKRFDAPICHGLLVGSMLCAPGGQWGWLATGMSFRFRRPTYVGQTVTCTVTIAELEKSGKARAEALMVNEGGEIVVSAELHGYLPVGDERELLGNIPVEYPVR